MPIEIEDDYLAKKFLGGWKNLVTGKEYHDGECQTIFNHGNKLNNKILVRSRVTQTSSKSKSKYTSSCHHINTQTSCLPELSDKLITPSSPEKYYHRVEGEQKILFLNKKYSQLEEESAIKIQKFYRACRMRTEISSLAHFAIATKTHLPKKDKLMKFGFGNSFKIINHCPPRTRYDFDMIINILDRWRILENQRINCTLFGCSKLTAKNMILNREIEILRTIERKKMKVNENNNEKDKLNYLEKLAAPEIWRTKDGKKTEVETLRVARARECRSMYTALMVKATASRLDTLKCLKNLILGHTCDKSRDLEYLVDQEINLSSQNMPDKMINQLQNRVKFAFFQFTLNCCEPSEIKVQEILKYCIRCKKLLSATNFQNNNTKILSTCERCSSLRPNKDPKILYEPYEQMLNELKKSELRMGCKTSLAFRIEPKILYKLVNIIWHGKSGISEFDDIFSLKLIRFHCNTEWSPWNSILLTKREAAIHQAMTNPWELYESSLIKKFLLRNLQAKLYFQSLVVY